MTDILMKRGDFGTSPVVHWLEHRVSTTGVQFRHLVGDLRSHKLCSVDPPPPQKKKKKKSEEEAESKEGTKDFAQNAIRQHSVGPSLGT